MRYEWGDQPPLHCRSGVVSLVSCKLLRGLLTFVIIGTVAEQADERELRWGERVRAS
jgi:hypothetical protein